MFFKIVNLFLLFIAVYIDSVRSDSFEQQCLDRHNILRARHGVPPLILDKSLTHFAQNWADKVAFNRHNAHQRNNEFGENISIRFESTDGAVPVQDWYNEIKNYNWQRPRFSLSTSHFPAVIWRDTRRLGCAVAHYGNRVVVVANYDYPGNVEKEFRSNVLPALIG